MNTDEYQEINIDGTQDEVCNKKKKNNGGFGKGVVVGILLTAVSMFLFIKVFTEAYGSYIVLGGGKAQIAGVGTVISENTAAKLEELQQYIDLYFSLDEEKEDVEDAMCHALVDSLGDRYSAYYNKEEYEEMMTSTTGSYYGIGAGLSQDKKTMEVTVSKIYEGTPSEEAGMQKDDMILMVEDIDATTMELSELVQHIRGEEGTTVHLTIYRPSTEELMELDVERRNVVLPSVSSQMLTEKVGYIEVSDFQKNTPDQFKEAIKALQEQGMEKMVVDLRNNPGGLVTSVVAMLDELLPEGVVVYTEDKYGNRTDYTSDEEHQMNIPLVVLVNENSASASEIFAGAIQDTGYGTILGTTTFGKGIVQSIWGLPSGGAIKLTTAKYFTPNGNNIHGKGIVPDVELPYEFLGGENDAYSVEFDNQIQKAIEILQ